MTPIFEQQLCEKYPKIFNTGAIEEKLPFPMFGIECEDGWYFILDSACRLIQHHIDYSHCSQVVATQIKEKFGTLRFYVVGGDDYIDGIITAFEYLSGYVCEGCGATGAGIGQTLDWIKTCCKECIPKVLNPDHEHPWKLLSDIKAEDDINNA